MKKIMTMGEILVEIMASERGQSFREPGILKGPYASGAPAIFIDQVAKLGFEAGIIGCVGDDDFGLLNIERLRRDGVDVSSIHVLKQFTTGSAFVTYRREGARDFIFNITNSASAQLSGAHVTEAALENCVHFHVMGSSLFSFRIVDAMKKAIEIVKRQGGTISFDPNIRKEMLRIPEMRDALRYILELTDIFLPSGNEVSILTKSADEVQAVEELLELGVREIVVKRGAAGASYFARGTKLDAPALPAVEVDPTGAGDCFGAAYITCRLSGHSPEESLWYGNAAGASAVAHFGPMEGAVNLATLNTLLAQRPNAS